MFGSLPMMPVQQQYVPQQYAPQPQMVQGQQPWPPQGQYQQPPGQYQAPRPAQPKAQPPQAWMPPPAQTAQATAPRQLPTAQPAVVRGKVDDPPEPPMRTFAPVKMPPAPLVLPSPESLNVTPVSTVDWNAAMVRFNRVGGKGIHAERLPDGRYRVALTLRTNVADQTHNIEATAANEADAVAAALNGAEEWAARR